jgi:uncharacterized membrane-anchored protein
MAYIVNGGRDFGYSIYQVLVYGEVARIQGHRLFDTKFVRTAWGKAPHLPAHQVFYRRDSKDIFGTFEEAAAHMVEMKRRDVRHRMTEVESGLKALNAMMDDLRKEAQALTNLEPIVENPRD